MLDLLKYCCNCFLVSLVKKNFHLVLKKLLETYLQNLIYLWLLNSFLFLSRFSVFLKSPAVTTFSNWFLYKSCLSRFLVLINCTMYSSFYIQLFSTFFIVKVFQGPGFSGPKFLEFRFFKVQVYSLRPGFPPRF